MDACENEKQFGNDRRGSSRFSGAMRLPLPRRLSLLPWTRRSFGERGSSAAPCSLLAERPISGIQPAVRLFIGKKISFFPNAVGCREVQQNMLQISGLPIRSRRSANGPVKPGQTPRQTLRRTFRRTSRRTLRPGVGPLAIPGVKPQRIQKSIKRARNPS